MKTPFARRRANGVSRGKYRACETLPLSQRRNEGRRDAPFSNVSYLKNGTGSCSSFS
jgi:hypothetical protein